MSKRKSGYSVRWFLVFAAAWLTPIVSRAGEPSKAPADPYAVVASAGMFTIGGVGFAGTVSEAETSLRKIAKQKDGEELCRKLLEEKNLAAQLYGLFGLKIVDGNAFAEAYPRFEKSRIKVRTASGCEVYERTVGELAKEIHDGTLN